MDQNTGTQAGKVYKFGLHNPSSQIAVCDLFRKSHSGYHSLSISYKEEFDHGRFGGVGINVSYEEIIDLFHSFPVMVGKTSLKIVNKEPIDTNQIQLAYVEFGCKPQELVFDKTSEDSKELYFNKEYMLGVGRFVRIVAPPKVSIELEIYANALVVSQAIKELLDGVNQQS